MIEGILLAAGESKRMGKSKMDSRLGSKTVLELSIEVFVSSSVDNTIVIVSPSQSHESIRKRGVGFVTNPDPSRGLSSSLKIGLESLDSRSESVVIGLGDKPLVLPSTIDSLISAHQASGSMIVVPVFKGKRGNPVLFGRSRFRDIMNLTGDTGAREVIRKNPVDVIEVKVEDPGILLDIDSPSDLERAMQLMDSRQSGKPRARD